METVFKSSNKKTSTGFLTALFTRLSTEPLLMSSVTESFVHLLHVHTPLLTTSHSTSSSSSPSPLDPETKESLDVIIDRCVVFFFHIFFFFFFSHLPPFFFSYLPLYGVFFFSNSVEQGLAALRKGDFVVVTDGSDRENEGDLIIAAEKATPEKIAFMVNETSGLICVGLEGDRLDELKLPQMVTQNTDPHATAFTVIDFIIYGRGEIKKILRAGGQESLQNIRILYTNVAVCMCVCVYVTV